MTRVAVIGSPDKPAVAEQFDRVRTVLDDRGDLVYAELTYDSSRAVPHNPDLLVVLGGDGTLISAVHALGTDQMPILGVNLGKLGYLAEFTLEELETSCDFLFDNDIPVRQRLLLDVNLQRASGETLHSVAVNDCVVIAGAPFRMIEMSIAADGDPVAKVRGDGLVVATPSGSTAHNLSAGGPILEPTAATFILTPICPHALTYRPVVMDAARTVEIRLIEGNVGTTASIDGQRNWHLGVDDVLTIRRFQADFQLVRNPSKSVWWSLRRKLMWGAAPKQPSAADPA